MSWPGHADELTVLTVSNQLVQAAIGASEEG